MLYEYRSVQLALSADIVCTFITVSVFGMFPYVRRIERNIYPGVLSFRGSCLLIVVRLGSLTRRESDRTPAYAYSCGTVSSDPVT